MCYQRWNSQRYVGKGLPRYSTIFVYVCFCVPNNRVKVFLHIEVRVVCDAVWLGC